MEEFEDIALAFLTKYEYCFVFKRNTFLRNRRAGQIALTVNSFFSSTFVLSWSIFFPNESLDYAPKFSARIMLCPTEINVRHYLIWRQKTTNVFGTTVVRSEVNIHGEGYELIVPLVLDLAEDEFWNKHPEIFIDENLPALKMTKNLYDDELIKLQINKSLEELNDDCLLSIFEYLPLADVIQMSEISPRFDSVVRKLLRNNLQFNAESFKSINLMERFIVKFGSSVTNMKVSEYPSFVKNDDTKKYLNELLTKYIDYDNLTSFHISLQNVHEAGEWSNKIRNVQNIYIEGSTNSAFPVTISLLNGLIRNANPPNIQINDNAQM